MTAAMAPMPAHADLKIVSEVSVTRSSPQSQEKKPNDSSPASSQDSVTQGSSLTTPHPSPDAEASRSPRTVTTYYKGSQARVEAADGGVTIYDLAAGKLYTLHPTDRTYGVASLQSILAQGPDISSSSSKNGRMRLESKVSLKQDKAAGKKTIAGREAVRYTLTGSAAVQRSSGGGFGRGGFPGGRRFPRGGRFPGGGFPGGGFPGGGFPGGGFQRGGFPGGGFPGGDNSDASGREPGGGDVSEGGRGAGRRGMPSMQLEGEYWIAAPPLGSKVKNALLPTVAQSVPAGPFLSPLEERLARLKGFPVASKVTATTSTPRSQSSTTITTTMEVKSISDDTLDASLFKVPADYRQVDPEPSSASQRASQPRQ
jgi:hypothetical protein